MKTKILFPIAFITILISGTAWFSPLTSFNLSQKFIISSNTIPDSVRTVFENSCVGCHAEDGSTLAMSKLNFSEWDNYSKKKQADKASKIYEELSEGKMPPKKARKKYPELIPTQEQVEIIKAWSEEMNSTVE